LKMTKKSPGLAKHLFRIPILLTVLILLSSAAAPLLLLGGHAKAAQLTVRSLSISSGQSAATSVIYTYGFTTVTVGSIQSLKFVACTTATATYGFASTASTTGCTAPTGLNINGASVAQQGTNTFTTTTAFARDGTGGGNCTPANNVFCAKRTQAASETAVAKTVAFNNITNPTVSGSGTTFYVGVYIYSDTAWATPTDSGTVASAVVPALTVTAAVAEILVFCVGSTSVDDATTAVGSASSCSGTTVDLGTLDPTAINYSKTSGNNLNGVAILRTNAINGSAVYYDAIQDTGTLHLGALRIPGSNCTTVPGSCITSKAAQGVFTAGTQDYGMTIAGTNCGTETAGGYYSCVYSSGTEHLVPQTGYIGQAGGYCSPANCNSGNGFKWDESGAASQIAAASANNVVADEALVLKFAATPTITNTFGAYQVKVDFTAVPTY
jgi:hypothetical protein